MASQSKMSDNMPLPKIRACLFDMDGLLIDSEDLYTICTNEVLREYGRSDMPWSIKAKLQGRPALESNRIFQEWAQLPCSDAEFWDKNQAYQRKYFPKSKPLPGIPQLLETLSGPANPNLQLALATSSITLNFHLKTDHMKDLFSVFPEALRFTGDDPRVPRGRGKPAPDIYLLALKTINERLRAKGLPGDIKPSECLVLEDSVPGVESGRRAGMQVLWCPHPELLKEYRGQEKEVLAGLTGEHDREVRPVDKLNPQGVSGIAGCIDDGWALLRQSLESFPYERYGLHSKPDLRHYN